MIRRIVEYRVQLPNGNIIYMPTLLNLKVSKSIKIKDSIPKNTGNILAYCWKVTIYHP